METLAVERRIRAEKIITEKERHRPKGIVHYRRRVVLDPWQSVPYLRKAAIDRKSVAICLQSVVLLLQKVAIHLPEVGILLKKAEIDLLKVDLGVFSVDWFVVRLVKRASFEK